MRQRFDYNPYGTVSRTWTNSSTTDNSEKRYRFGGKEIAGSSLTDLSGTGATAGAAYLDFGARLYSPRTATWLSPDPLMENHFGFSPFVYSADSPMNYTDPEGKDWTRKKRDDTITVSMTIYSNKQSSQSAKQAAEYWNRRVGDKYFKNNKEYQIKYDIQVLEVDSINRIIAVH